MQWKLPPKIKIYEALGCVGDDRIELDGSEAKVYSSSGNKFYSVKYDSQANAIMSNDNGSYWQGYIGYPAIAYLMKIGVIKINQIYAEALKGIQWKDINTEFKNDFEKTIAYVHEVLQEKGISVDEFLKEIDGIDMQIRKMNLEVLGKKTKPPVGY